ncbi:MAG: hemerythrin domain-containing protein [Planctomycetota bacterium]|nr:hemerythrin domain-containing protein [Planctomycetota bacterium]
MKPTDVLRHEHEVILMVLSAAERLAGRIEEGQAPDGDKIAQVIEFSRHFIDRCHHAKEEKHLFPMLRERSPHAAEGPLAVMRHEHEEGRAVVREIAEALALAHGDGQPARMHLAERLVFYVDLLQAHIDKEDNILFPMAERVLRAEDQEALTDAFARIEAEELGAGVHEKYHQLAHELAGQR